MEEKDRTQQIKVIQTIVSSYDLDDDTKYDAIRSVVRNWDYGAGIAYSTGHSQYNNLSDAVKDTPTAGDLKFADSVWPGLKLETRRTVAQSL